MLYVELLVIPALAGLPVPEPEFCNGYKVIVAAGAGIPDPGVPAIAVDPEKVKSGSTRQTNPKLCPSPISNSDEEIYAGIAVTLPRA
jgi:hypothetical protein